MFKNFILPLILSIILFLLFSIIIPNLFINTGFFIPSPYSNALPLYFLGYILVAIIGLLKYWKDKNKISFYAILIGPILLVILLIISALVIFRTYGPPVA